jgi:hypothetical protein
MPSVGPPGERGGIRFDLGENSEARPTFCSCISARCQPSVHQQRPSGSCFSSYGQSPTGTLWYLASKPWLMIDCVCSLPSAPIHVRTCGSCLRGCWGRLIGCWASMGCSQSMARLTTMVYCLGIARLSGWFASFCGALGTVGLLATCDTLASLGLLCDYDTLRYPGLLPFIGTLATLGYLVSVTRCPIWTTIIVGRALRSGCLDYYHCWARFTFWVFGLG